MGKMVTKLSISFALLISLELDLLLETRYGIISMEIKSRKLLAEKDLSGLKQIATAPPFLLVCVRGCL